MQQGEPGDCMFVVQSGEVIARHRATGDMGSGTEVRVAQACIFKTCICSWIAVLTGKLKRLVDT